MDKVGPWMVAWQWSAQTPVLVMSERILRDMVGPDRAPDLLPGSPVRTSAVGLYMDAQQEQPFVFKQHASAVRIKTDLERRVRTDSRYRPEFECRVLTKQELDQWRIEAELKQIASQEGTGP